MAGTSQPSTREQDHELLIKIDGKLDNVVERLNKINGSVGRHDQSITDLIADQKAYGVEIKRLDERDAELDVRTRNWTMVNSLGAVIAAVLGAIGISK